MFPTSLSGRLDQLTIEVVRCGSLLQREAGRLFKPFEVSAAQFNVINLLADQATGMRATEITEALVVDPSSTTYLLDQLEERGWATRARDLGDRRALRVMLTPAGKSIHRKVRAAYEGALKEMAKHFEPGELGETVALLGKLSHSAQLAVDRATGVAPVLARGGLRKRSSAQ